MTSLRFHTDVMTKAPNGVDVARPRAAGSRPSRPPLTGTGIAGITARIR